MVEIVRYIHVKCVVKRQNKIDACHGFRFLVYIVPWGTGSE